LKKPTFRSKRRGSDSFELSDWRIRANTICIGGIDTQSIAGGFCQLGQLVGIRRSFVYLLEPGHRMGRKRVRY